MAVVIVAVETCTLLLKPGHAEHLPRLRCHVAQTSRVLSPPLCYLSRSQLFTCRFLLKPVLSYFWGLCLLLLLCMDIPSPSSLLTPSIANSWSSFRSPYRCPLLQETSPDTSPARLTHVPLLPLPQPFVYFCPVTSSHHSRGSYSPTHLSLLRAPARKEGLLVSYTRVTCITVFQDHPCPAAWLWWSINL